MLTRYGILDDAGQVVRWVTDKPQHSQYITQHVDAKPRATPYQIAMACCGEAPF